MLFKRGTNIGTGSATVVAPGIAVPLVQKSTPVCMLTLAALLGQAGSVVVIGDRQVVAATSARKGTPVPSGVIMTITDVDDLSKIWVDADHAGDGATFTYYY